MWEPTTAVPRKLLALDGGGIRGVISLQMLARLERLLQQSLGRDDTFVLADYFDYISGTSTGAIIASCLSLGMSVAAIEDFYLNCGAAMFDKARLLDRFRYKYQDEKLAHQLKQVLGENTTLGSSKIKTLLLLMMRNATTDSPWPISNNPRAHYNDSNRPDCNLQFPLWQLVRASTAAPTYFPPETIFVGQKPIIFVDGGITMYNNPAFQHFLMATLPIYQLQWPTGEKNLLLISIGTGSADNANFNLAPHEMNLLYNASSIPAALMHSASVEQDFLCRVFGNCRFGAAIDREVNTLSEATGGFSNKLFSYVRYNADLTSSGLQALGLADIPPQRVQQMDSVAHLTELQAVGRAAALAQIQAEHFISFV